MVILTVIIRDASKSAQLWQRLLLGNILSVGLLTWVVMPVVTRALRFWFIPAETPASPAPT